MGLNNITWHQVNPVLEKKKKTYDAGTGPVPDEADEVRDLFIQDRTVMMVTGMRMPSYVSTKTNTNRSDVLYRDISDQDPTTRWWGVGVGEGADPSRSRSTGGGEEDCIAVLKRGGGK
jgi:hypothetical protein